MEKTVTALLLAVLLSLALTCAKAAVGEAGREEWLDGLEPSIDSFDKNVETADARQAPVFHLPASLQFIEDEAFEGTAIVSVELPDTVESIGERAFANIPTLHSVKIPERTKQIAKTAFAGSRQMILTGAPGSYARAWARENGVPFAPVTVMRAAARSAPVSTSAGNQKTDAGDVAVGTAERDEKPPQWRSVGEIKSDQYEACIANQIVSRAPPARA